MRITIRNMPNGCHGTVKAWAKGNGQSVGKQYGQIIRERELLIARGIIRLVNKQQSPSDGLTDVTERQYNDK